MNAFTIFIVHLLYIGIQHLIISQICTSFWDFYFINVFSSSDNKDYFDMNLSISAHDICQCDSDAPSATIGNTGDQRRKINLSILYKIVNNLVDILF